MTSGINTIIYPVRDLATAKALYGMLLGVEPTVDEPYYIQFNANGQQVGLDPNGHAQGLTGPVAYLAVDDIEASVQALVAAGAEAVQPVREVGAGRKVASLKDADGNMIGVMQDS